VKLRNSNRSLTFVRERNSDCRLRGSKKWQRNINRSMLETRPIRISLWQSYPRHDYSALIITCLKFRPHEISQFYVPPRSLETLTRGTDISHEPVTTVTRERSIHLPVCDIPPRSTRKEVWKEVQEKNVDMYFFIPAYESEHPDLRRRVGFPITILHFEFCPLIHGVNQRVNHRVSTR